MRRRFISTGMIMLLVSALLIGVICPIVAPFLVDVYSPTSQPIALGLYSGVLVVETDGGQGSCFVVAKRDGWYYAITAAHVTDGATSLLIDGEWNAEVVKVDAEEDVSLIRFPSSEDYRIYAFGKARLGEVCAAVGYSRGSKLVYKGHVASLDMEGRIVANGGVVPGCSGGVLLNGNGEAIGVTVALAVYRGWAFDNTALFVPIRFARALLVAVGEN